MNLKKNQYMYTCTLESKAISLLSVSRDILLSICMKQSPLNKKI